MFSKHDQKWMCNGLLERVGRKLWWGVGLTAVILILSACGGGDEGNTPAPVVEIEGEEPSDDLPVQVEVEPTEDAVEEVAEEVVEPTATPLPLPTSTPQPTATPAGPTVSLASGEYIYSNGNKVRDVALFNDALWASSTGGLVRYDLASGEARKYTTLDGLPNIGTYSVEVCPVDGEDRLIVGHRDGLSLYDAATDSWEDGSLIGYNDDNAIHEMRCDGVNGRLILEYDDISVLDLASKTMTHYTEDDDGLAWFVAEQIVVIGDDIRVPTDFKGVSRIGIDGTVETFNEESGLPDDNVGDVALDANGVYWMGASDGLLQYENGTFTLYDRDSHPDLIDFFGPSHVETATSAGSAQAVDGTLWLGFHSDICHFDPATISCIEWIDVEDDLGMPDGASIARLEAVADGGLLMHTYNDGVAYFDGTEWATYALENQTPTNFFDGLYEASDGTIWVYGDGVYATDLEASGWEALPNIGIDDLVEDADGNLWMVSGRRVVQFTGAQIFMTEVEDGLLDSSNNAIAVTDDGMVYAVGSTGYSVLNGDTITTVGEEQGWDLGNMRDVIVVDGTVYAGTIDGLVTLKGESWTQVLDETYIGLPSDNIGVIDVLPDGTLLLGTTSGLAMYKDGEVTAVSEVTGSVSDIFVTEDGQIHVVAFWSSGNDGGYYHFDGSSWNFRPDTEFPMSSLRAVMVDAAGTTWIGMGDTGLGGGIFRIVP